MSQIYEYKILLVDDEKEIVEIEENILRKEGFSKVFKAHSCEEALNVMHAVKPDLAILDVMLPDGDGYLLFQKFKRLADIPILFLTAKDQDYEKLIGLSMGADDYLTKPFLPQELVLRIKSILRRTYTAKSRESDWKPIFNLSNCVVNLNTGVACIDDKQEVLTAKEYAILEMLYANHGRIVSSDLICEKVWHDNPYGYENTLMVNIRRLRTKIEKNPSSPESLITVKGLGYKLIVNEDKRNEETK